ncbi:MAG: cation:proton antiporter [Granulosicoccaceae bacterium]
MIFSLFLVFFGAAVMATIVLFAGQALLLAYIAVGVLTGPWGFNWISNPALIADISNIGILFLLFLLGLNLELAELKKMLRQAVLVTVVSSLAFAAVGFGVAMLFSFSVIDSVLAGIIMMFSSTIIALKLLPTSALHHQRMGELIVSVLLLQDMIAITVMIILQSIGHTNALVRESAILIIGLPLFVIGAWFVSKHALTRLFLKFDQIQEYLFLVAIGWCLGLAELSTVLGLSHEIGAFIAGVTLATSPIARFLAESLKPLRDFFLVLFFFALGASINLDRVPEVLIPAAFFALLSVFLKPVVFRVLLERDQDKATKTRETSVRLSQISEFSLLIIVVAIQSQLLTDRAALMLQTATLLSFVLSSFWVVKHYPTPIATNKALRRD